MGPAILIAIGVLFLLDRWRGDYFRFHYTWPVILLVIGLVKLAESLASTEGHIDSSAPPQVPQAPGPPAQS
ncbi:MAG TPA: DUF5668 domain-containing protein [Methylomirabilota bacterium]|jgi:hypothetical protein|nr:DUF5668 domain-containing protein [Methylomirabilota bacterium]